MIKSLIKGNRKLISNIFSLGSIDAVTLILPFIYLPLVVQQLGIEKYSTVVLHQAIYLIVSVIIQFGFNIYGVAEFHKINGDKEKQKDLYWVLFFSRVAIFTCTTICSMMLAYFLFDTSGFFLVCLGIIYNLGDIFFLRWYCQASGKLKFLALLIAVQKIVQLILVLIVLAKGVTEQLYLGALIVPYLIFNLMFFWYFAQRIGIFIPLRLFQKMIQTFRNAGQYLSSRLVAVLVDKTPIFMLELFGINGAAGVYDLVMKIVGACQTPFNVVCQAYYSLSFTAKSNVALFRIISLCFIAFFILYFALTSNPSILDWYFGDSYASAVPLLNILLLSIGINVISHNIGISGLIPSGLGGWFNTSVYLSAVAYFSAIFYVWFIGAVTTLIIAKVTLFYLAVLMVLRILIFIMLSRRVI
jgi:PST family polysaccharide transporter